MKKRDSLIISEKFYSLQGEGQTMGVPSIFLRLAGCNILCKGKGWICDSIEVWKKGNKTHFKDVFTKYEVALLKDGVHLILTGGEPLLHQDAILDFFDWFTEEYKFIPTIEVETNGTIQPKWEFACIIDYWNCSPKLSTSGESKDRRIKPDVIKYINQQSDSIFKFVISEERDIDEMCSDYLPLIDKEKVVLMPAGESQDNLQKTRLMVAEKCIEYQFKYCDRLHIVIWNQKTGV